jgi:GntR family transcriptional regulator, transcriptional repressor for pyruvate dehydrogenase complex
MSEEPLSSSELMNKINAVRKKNTYEIIIEQLKDLIITGELKPGQKLPGERDLAKVLGASRNSLRLALKVLEFMRLIEIRHGLGVYVAAKEDLNEAILNFHWFEMSAHHPLLELLEARKCFEPFMTALCARNATESQIAEMEKDLQTMEECLERKELGVEQASIFHTIILNSAGNFILLQIGTMLRNLMDESKRVSLSNLEYTRQSLDEHRGILEAVKNKDPETAAARMLAHLESVQQHLESTAI